MKKSEDVREQKWNEGYIHIHCEQTGTHITLILTLANSLLGILSFIEYGVDPLGCVYVLMVERHDLQYIGARNASWSFSMQTNGVRVISREEMPNRKIFNRCKPFAFFFQLLPGCMGFQMCVYHIKWGQWAVWRDTGK